MDMVQGGASVGPDKFFLELANLSLEVLYLTAVGLAFLKAFYLRREAQLDVVNALQSPKPHGVAKDTVTEATTHFIGVPASHIVKIVVDILLLLETVALLEEVGITHHLNATLVQIVQSVFHGFLQKGVGDRVVTRGHDGEMHLI